MGIENRIVRLLTDPPYRSHVREVVKLFVRYPNGLRYKGAALLMNRTLRVAQRLHNRKLVGCGVCGWTGNAFEALATFGYLRRNARCPNCGSLERHRAMVNFLTCKKWIHDAQSCLDIGGIPPFRSWFEKRGLHYVSLSLGDPAMVCMDVQHLGFACQSFDLILDSHVLEYVRDYKQALRELWRVMRPGGKMLLTESYLFGQAETEEFGRADPAATFMVRRFGDDLLEFLTDAGFNTVRWDYCERNDESGDYFFLCEKPTVTR